MIGAGNVVSMWAAKQIGHIWRGPMVGRTTNNAPYFMLLLEKLLQHAVNLLLGLD